MPAPAFQVMVRWERPEGMTGRVVYPEVWWRHDSTGLRDLQLARIEAALGMS